jgi:hypothetical protein
MNFYATRVKTKEKPKPNNKTLTLTTVRMRQQQIQGVTQKITLAASVPFSTGSSTLRIEAASTSMDSGTSWQVTAPPLTGHGTLYRSRFLQQR